MSDLHGQHQTQEGRPKPSRRRSLVVVAAVFSIAALVPLVASWVTGNWTWVSNNGVVIIVFWALSIAGVVFARW